MTNPIARVLVSLALLCAPLPALAANPVKTERTKHYEFTHDLDAETAREVATHMDTVFDEYAKRMSNFRVKNAKRIKLYVWADRETYIEFLTEQGVPGAQFTGGLFFVRGGDAGLTTFVGGQSRASMYHTLQHEGFHQFAHLRVGNLPPWANEGLAEYFGHGLLIRRNLLTGVAPSTRIELLRNAVAQGQHYPFEEIINMSGQEWNNILQSGDPRAYIMYTEAWAIAHFLVNADNGKYASAFQKYLEWLSKGRSHEQAFQQAFGTSDMVPFEKRFIEYLNETWEPDELSTAQQRLDFLGEGLRALHERGITPTSIDDLKTKLRERDFEVVRRGHGGAEVLSAQDDDMFLAPGQTLSSGGDEAEPEPDDSRRRGRSPRRTRKPSPRQQAPEIEFVPAGDAAYPPTIRMSGLRAPARIEWTHGPDGSLTHVVRFD